MPAVAVALGRRVEAGRLERRVEAGRLARWPRARAAVLLRSILQALVLFPVVRWLCRPLRIEGRERLRGARGPFVFVANHASHADTALILRALPRRIRRRTAPAAAEDYFFRNRFLGGLVSLLIGAFPFPRRGSAGLARAEGLLAQGWSVVLFPEGTRSTDGRPGEFRAGVGVLASWGATIVPIGIAGACDVLPKGHGVPRRAPVALMVGEPIGFERGSPPQAVADLLRGRVCRLSAGARLVRPGPRRTWHERAGALARSPRGLVLAFCWGLAEALVFPIVPDFAVALLALAAPSRFLLLVLAATAGSVAGGVLSYFLGAAGLVPPMPLVTERMRETAAVWIGEGGADAIGRQPWSGIPFKAFGFQAAGEGVAAMPFALHMLLARGLRILVSALVFGSLGWLLGRWPPLRRRWPRLYGGFAAVFTVVFGWGLARVVASWS